MNRKVVSEIILTVLLISISTLAFNIQQAKASGTIYIRANGSVDPPTAHISTVDNITYTFTGNISEPIVLQRHNIVIDGNGYTLQGPGIGNGFYSSGINGVTIKNVVVDGWEYGMALYQSNCSISSNTIKNTWGGTLLRECSGDNISGNNAHNNTYAILLDLSSGYKVSDNIINNNGGGIYLRRCSSKISGNTVNNSSAYGIHLDECSGNNISGNTINNNLGGISLWISTQNNISSNTIRNSTQQGIALWKSSSNSISGNNITNNHYDGIRLSESSNSSISGNNITNNSVGIALATSSNYNNISQNNVMANSEGIWLFGSSNNVISENNVKDNKNSGIRLQGSSNSMIYHNNIINNTNQVKSLPDSCENIWDDGYPSGGNYWSDYEDRYTDAQELDDSGIWDIPYVIDENNQDNYPLMKPWMPPGLFADLVRRQAWPEHRHYDISKDDDGYQTLYTKVKNHGNLTIWLKAVFRITKDDGSAAIVESEPLLIEAGTEVDLSANFGPLTNADAGNYYVSATCWYSQNKIVWRQGEREKTFSFKIASTRTRTRK